MNLLTNLDLFSVGLTVAGIALLGFTLFFSNRKSRTNQAFLFFSATSILWSILNYSYYQISDANASFWVLRLVIFVAVWHVVSFFLFAHVFPKEEYSYSKFIKFVIVPIAILTSILNLTPLVFHQVTSISASGQIATIENGPAIALFVTFASVLVVWGIILLGLKTFRARGTEKTQYRLVLSGVFITFFLLLTFNLVLPAAFNNPRYIPLGALYIFPFIAFTFYAIFKHHLFNIKNVTTILIAFALTVTTFLEIIYSVGFDQILFRSSIFLLVLIFSIQLVRNMINLERANVRLQELDQLKSEFVSLATHQIRAPLSAIKGYLSEVFEGDFGPVTKELEKPLQIVFQSTENLVHIVGDFLNISRIEQGRMKYELAPINLKQLVTESLKELKPNLERAGLEMKFEAPEDDYEVYADIGKLKEVVANLVDNAMKYTPKGSIKISLSSNVQTQKVLLAVSDTGIGIAPEVIPKLFQKFTRAKDANEVNIIGTGLGLYVAQLMIEGQSGRIWAESPGVGKGSTFYVELPVAHVS